MCSRHIWCLDFKGGLFCSTLPETGLTWQRFEDNVHQVALSPSGELLKSHRIDERCERQVVQLHLLAMVSYQQPKNVFGFR